MNIWTVGIEEILKQFETSTSGLSDNKYNELVAKNGKNEMEYTKKKSPYITFLSQFKNPLILILLLVVVISFFTKDNTDGFIILGLLLVNAVIGFVQELKAQKSLEKLKKLVKMKVKVIRDGKISIQEAEDIVLGDLVILNKGDYVPADIRLLEAHNLLVNEATLTGESLEVGKDIRERPTNLEPQDIKNGVFQGTFISEGNGRGIVVATGKDTFLGMSVEVGGKKEIQTNFAKKFNLFGKILFVFVLVIAGAAFGINVYLGRDLLTSFMLGITLALGLAPETMPVILSVSLANAAIKLSKKSLLIKRLNVFEDMGNIDVICSDKTGTITTGVLKPIHFLNTKFDEDEKVREIGILCNANNPAVNSRIMPNVIDDALWNASNTKERMMLRNIKEVWDFDFNTRVMGVEDEESIIYIKGAYENIIEMSNLSVETRKGILEKLKRYEEQGGRLIGIGKKKLHEKVYTISKVNNLEIVGFIVLVDPPREKMEKEFLSLERLNISLKIISGDSENVTRAICEKVGLDISQGKIWRGEELEKLNNNQLQEVVNKYNIFSRVSPSQKVRIVEGIKNSGHVVGYVGDGINDVGALTVADVGISVDSGVDVAKDCADIIVLKRDLSTIVSGIKEGRKVFNNTMKYIFSTISSSFGDVITITFASLFLPFLPLLPVQVILLGFLSDIQDLTLSTDNVDEELISKPKNWDMAVFVRYVVFWGLLSTIFDFALFFIIRRVTNSPEEFRTVWMIESVLTAVLAELIIRTPRPFFKSKPSVYFFISSIFSCLLAIIIPYIPLVSGALGFTKPLLYLLGMALILTIVYMGILELVKRGYFKRFLGVEYKYSFLRSLIEQH